MNSETSSHPSTEGHIPEDLKKPGAPMILGVLVLLLCLLGAMYFIGYGPRQKQSEEIQGDASARAGAVPRVSVTRPKSTPGDSEVTLNCDIKANKSTTIIARTNGYLKTLHAEIDDVVKEGQLLAEIDTPEVDAELARSKASLNQAKASAAKSTTDLELAERNLKREAQLAPGARTEEELDIRKTARDDASNSLARAQADVEYAEAEIKRLSTLQGFQKVVAPYAGRITFRFLDVGALISPGDNAHAELFTMAETATARIIIHAPQSYATDINLAGKPVLTVRNYPGREFVGTIAGNAGQFDPATRTMLFLLLFPNPDGALYPGMYGQVKLALSSRKPVLQIPTSSLISGSLGTQVMIVDHGVVHLRNVATGRDFGTNIEVLTGVTPDDQIAVNPQVQMVEGTKVEALLREDEKVASTAKLGAK
jgi:membrane fusion protein, multidrug efflux system